MKLWRVLVAVPLASLASQALAENWVTVATFEDGTSYSIDKNSIRRGSDGLVYYTDKGAYDGNGDRDVAGHAMDCERHLSYLLKVDLMIGTHVDYADWRDHGDSIKAGTALEGELNYVCANAG